MEQSHDNWSAFFVDDMLSFVFNECRIPWTSLQTNFMRQNICQNEMYSFKPEIGRALMWILVVYRKRILRNRKMNVRWIQLLNDQNRKIVLEHGILYDNLLLDTNIVECIKSVWLTSMYTFLATVSDLCIHYHRTEQMNIISDIVWAAKSTLRAIMLRNAKEKFLIINQFAKSF